jgi:hypothetical protein
MTNPIQKKPEMQELNLERLFGSTEGAEPNEETITSITDQDTMLGMTVLLLVCLSLAILAHVVV